MGQFSLIHWLVVILILMLFFGPSKIEGLGKSLGRAIRGFKDGMNEIDAEAKEVENPKPSPENLASTQSSEPLRSSANTAKNEDKNKV